LIRLKQLVCAQSEAFSEIEIRKATGVATIASPSVPATEAEATADGVGQASRLSQT
jgi:hypothetical protein